MRKQARERERERREELLRERKREKSHLILSKGCITEHLAYTSPVQELYTLSTVEDTQGKWGEGSLPAMTAGTATLSGKKKLPVLPLGGLGWRKSARPFLQGSSVMNSFELSITVKGNKRLHNHNVCLHATDHYLRNQGRPC